MEGVTHKRGVLEVHFRVVRVPLVQTHLLRELPELHKVFFKSYALYYLVDLVEGVTHKRGVLEVQFRIERVPQVQSKLLFRLAELHKVFFTSYALY